MTGGPKLGRMGGDQIWCVLVRSLGLPPEGESGVVFSGGLIVHGLTERVSLNKLTRFALNGEGLWARVSMSHW